MISFDRVDLRKLAEEEDKAQRIMLQEDYVEKDKEEGTPIMMTFDDHSETLQEEALTKK